MIKRPKLLQDASNRGNASSTDSCDMEWWFDHDAPVQRCRSHVRNAHRSIAVLTPTPDAQRVTRTR